MKKYMSIYLKVFFFMSILFLLLALIVVRRFDVTLPFARISYGIFVVSAFVSLTLWLFKLEKGNSILNVILGYFMLIPGILVIRNVYGNYLFRLSSLIYIIMIVIGIIYGIVLWIVSKKYKKQVDDLNKLIENQNKS